MMHVQNCPIITTFKTMIFSNSKKTNAKGKYGTHTAQKKKIYKTRSASTCSVEIASIVKIYRIEFRNIANEG